jgi:gas vesicle protein
MKFDKDQILEALGIETSGSWLGIALAGFGIGCVVGAAVAMLVAPKSGSELRSDLMGKGRDFIRRGREEIDEAVGKTSSAPTY